MKAINQLYYELGMKIILREILEARIKDEEGRPETTSLEYFKNLLSFTNGYIEGLRQAISAIEEEGGEK